MKSSVTENVKGYRRGVVLGLTMAETMFLLVFILLLIMNGVLQSAKKEQAKLQAEIISLKKEVELADGLTFSPEERKAVESLVRTVEKSLEDRKPNDLVDALKKLETAQKTLRNKIPEDWQKLVRMKEQVEENGGIEALVEAKKQNEILKTELKSREGNDWPPLIRLSEADGFSFQLGKAELTPDFEGYLRKTVAPLLVEMKAKYGVDVVEVVGHTDLVRMAGAPSNLDDELGKGLGGSVPISSLVPSDNAGLGMSRAVAVVRVLLQEKQLSGLRILPLSGAQLIGLNDQLDAGTALAPSGKAARRRIEIRLRRATKTQELSNPN